MLSTMKYLWLFVFLVLGIAVVACGGSDEDQGFTDGWDLTSVESAAAPAAARAEMVLAMSEEAQADGGAMVKRQAPAPDPASAPVAAAAAVVGAPGLPGKPGSSVLSDPQVADDSGESLPGGDTATLVQQRRIIVRTVDMGIVVGDVGESIDAIGGVAEEMGGWLVSSSHADERFGFVSVRVPAERLDEAIQRLRAMAQDVESEITSSRDVTDEYYDIQARLTNLEATEGRSSSCSTARRRSRTPVDPAVVERGARGYRAAARANQAPRTDGGVLPYQCESGTGQGQDEHRRGGGQVDRGR